MALTQPLTADTYTEGSVGDRALGDDHKLPARGKDQTASEGSDVNVTNLLNALDVHKQDRNERGVASGYAPLGSAATVAPAFGAPPVGAIVPVAGTFDAADNGGTYDETGVDVSGAWMLCDGSQITDGDSPFNGRYVPKLDDGRFLRANAIAGGVGGSATRNPRTSFAAGGSYVPSGSVSGSVGNTSLSISQIPSHNHGGGGHGHSFRTESGTGGNAVNSTRNWLRSQDGAGDAIQSTSATSGTITGTITQSVQGSGTIISTQGGGNSHSHGWSGSFSGDSVAHTEWFLNSDVNIEPAYFNAKFYQRIK